MSVKKMKQFEDHIREAFEGHEAPYNPKAWSKLEASLGGKLGGFSSSLKIALCCCCYCNIRLWLELFQ